MRGSLAWWIELMSRIKLGCCRVHQVLWLHFHFEKMVWAKGKLPRGPLVVAGGSRQVQAYAGWSRQAGERERRCRSSSHGVEASPMPSIGRPENVVL
ncbi:hypothetical protein BKA81DRAFT_369697 [Phyllosticta paracitricarpa]